MTGVYAHPFPGGAHGCRPGLHPMSRHRHGWGGGPDFGGRGSFAPGGRGGGRRRMRRGDVRAAILVLLAEQPYNGYGLMQEIENRSEGVWRPSPGSVYPSLAQLEDEELVRSEEAEGRKQFVLTEGGRAYVEDNREKLGEPWAQLAGEVGEGRFALRGLIGQVAAAAMQVGQAGTDEQVAQARQVLVDARKALYRLLADAED